MVKTMLRFMAVSILLLLFACSSTPEQSSSENRRAAETNTALGRQYMQRGDYEIALEKLKRAIAHDKTYAPAHTMLAVLYETIGEMEAAGVEYRRAVQYDPKDGSVNNNYGAYLCGVGKHAEAERYFLTAVDDPFYRTPEVALANAGSCALAAGDLDKAETYLRQSLGYDDQLAAALLPMAEVSYRKGSYLKARAFLQRFEAVSPATRESLLLGYNIETNLGDEAAVQRYQRALQEKQNSASVSGRSASQEQK